MFLLRNLLMRSHTNIDNPFIASVFLLKFCRIKYNNVRISFLNPVTKLHRHNPDACNQYTPTNKYISPVHRTRKNCKDLETPFEIVANPGSLIHPEKIKNKAPTQNVMSCPHHQKRLRDEWRKRGRSCHKVSSLSRGHHQQNHLFRG